MNLILFGFKGSGKTHFGKLLAHKLGRPFIDTDDLIVEIFGQKELTVRQVYQKVGETEYRVLEAEVIRRLNGVQKSVIALGAGAILNHRELVEKLGTLIYLETSLETLIKRKIDSAVGPLEPLYHQRLPLYRAIPAIKINTDLHDETTILEKLYAL
jgi:shikimate kinase